MNEVLNKMAIFDFMANLITGLCAWAITQFVLEKVYLVSVNINMSLNELIYPESVKLVRQKSLKRRCDKEYRDFRKSPNG